MALSSILASPRLREAVGAFRYHPKLIKILRRHLAKQGAARLKAGSAYKDLALVFANEYGQPLREHNLIVRHFKPILERAKLPKEIRLYDLRHSCATILLEQGEHPKVVAERLEGTAARQSRLTSTPTWLQRCRKTLRRRLQMRCTEGGGSSSHTPVTQRAKQAESVGNDRNRKLHPRKG
jgi:integrase